MVRTFTLWVAPLLHLARGEHAEGEVLPDSGEVDPLVLGLRDISAAVLDLAKAAQLALPSGALHATSETVSAALHERVKALAPPAPTN